MDKRRNEEVPEAFFSQRIQLGMQRMSEQTGENWDIRKLSGVLDVSYEYLRRIVRGEQLPSPSMRNLLGEILKIDKTELKTLYAADKIRRDYGTIPLEIAGKNPELEPIARVWEYLTDEHKKLLTTQAKNYAKIDRLKQIDPFDVGGE